MDKEPLSNMGLICKNCSPEPGRYKGQNPETFIGNYVKLKFPTRDEKSNELLWVLVCKLGTQGTQLEGVLVNDPVLDVGFVCLDGVGFDVREIVLVKGDLYTHKHNHR